MNTHGDLKHFDFHDLFRTLRNGKTHFSVLLSIQKTRAHSTQPLTRSCEET